MATAKSSAREDARPSVYLAGPDVFLLDAIEAGNRKKDLCQGHGLIGLFPFDNEIPKVLDIRIDLAIYRANVSMMREADAGIFNLTPFRGPSADVGTAFELGMMAAMGKPIFAYSNESEPFLGRVKVTNGLKWNAAKNDWRDRFDMSTEDFGNVDNLMLDNALREQGRAIHRRSVAEAQRFTDLDGFVACLEEARAVLAAMASAA